MKSKVILLLTLSISSYLYGSPFPKSCLKLGNDVDTILLLSVANPDLSECTKIAIENGADVDHCVDGNCPVVIAAKNNNLNGMNLLIEANVNVNQFGSDPKSALHYLVENQMTSTISRIGYGSYPVDISLTDKESQRNVLNHAAYNNYLKIFVILASIPGAKQIASSPDKEGKTPLYYATFHGNHGISREIKALSEINVNCSELESLTLQRNQFDEQRIERARKAMNDAIDVEKKRELRRKFHKIRYEARASQRGRIAILEEFECKAQHEILGQLIES